MNSFLNSEISYKDLDQVSVGQIVMPNNNNIFLQNQSPNILSMGSNLVLPKDDDDQNILLSNGSHLLNLDEKMEVINDSIDTNSNKNKMRLRRFNSEDYIGNI